MHKGKGMKFVGDSRISAERKPNIPKDYSEYPGRTEAFWPNFLLKEWLVGAVFLVGFLSLTVAHPSPLEGMADPTNAAYIPLPDWYFLFLYQLLKYEFASGTFSLIGIIVLPGLAFGALLLAPFLDQGPGRRPHQRPVAVGMMLLGLAAVMWLTYESSSHVDWETRAEANKPIPPSAIEIDKEDPGYAIYEGNCMSCHGEDLTGGPAAPALIGTEHSAEEIAKIAQEGIGSMPPDQFQGTDEELKQLVDFIVSVNEGAE
ncbi:menaquinol-cytochrome c reductase cytochrome b/c subunit [Virgibacillus halodenitrificans]|uniref:Menaquinol:cytochrome c reductase cytochrome c subunit n=1 Tax=Virgibacillus halodenitrificans TaxID=1482 RepID=A0ABR7VKZ4_VIRHA|nr:menaquinol-cytochrome c reductase cytochrome b/c subunit [Virgibacillus halodenitrificans]MBD1222599.1 c-type cytochrome [Virgibacillus halodenitrificans]MCG1028316.1 c-type cytochrome [Virgibacillus halodenitrificans]MCJ0931018.1 c-type cytochrome [Virgibacillus halodenitrificans]MEC2160405.1 c-type cytochrome [Virgibacillus halodenitrificans]MYL45273.1 cytochrome C oxidase Cbb3 [Virgibacillus halodenitrificans]